MPISTAVQRGSTVYVYNEKNIQIGMHSGELHGYSGSTVSIKRGSTIYTYNENNMQISMQSTR